MKFFQRFLGVFLVLTILSASTPLSLMHDHEHIEACQVNLNLAEKSKTDKDPYPEHLHTAMDDCFICFENHQFTTGNFLSTIENNIAVSEMLFLELDIVESNSTPHFVFGRAPPCLSI